MIAGNRNVMVRGALQCPFQAGKEGFYGGAVDHEYEGDRQAQGDSEGSGGQI
jgi:hypothetical protein